MRSRAPRIVIPILSLLGLLFAAQTILKGMKGEPLAPTAAPPPKAPYANTVAGAGIIEPAGERTTTIYAAVPGLVLKRFVSVGAVVSRGAPLFQIDDRSLLAQLAVRNAAHDAAKARLARLVNLPRKEDLPPREARVQKAEAALGQQSSLLSRLEAAMKAGHGAVSADEVERRRWAVSEAKATLADSRAELESVKAGAWGPELELAKAELAQTEAAIQEVATEIDRSCVRAPIDGTILSLDVDEGETATNRPLCTIGDLTKLTVRVDVDEESAPVVRAGAHAVAMVRGIPEDPIALEFLRIEPQIRPKLSLTGNNKERVDTRVLQVLFKVGKTRASLYVGQQLDIFIDATTESQ